MADARRAELADKTDISGARALIVEARFYDDIQDALLEGAVAELQQDERGDERVGGHPAEGLAGPDSFGFLEGG